MCFIIMLCIHTKKEGLKETEFIYFVMAVIQNQGLISTRQEYYHWAVCPSQRNKIICFPTYCLTVIPIHLAFQLSCSQNHMTLVFKEMEMLAALVLSLHIVFLYDTIIVNYIKTYNCVSFYNVRIVPLSKWESAGLLCTRSCI